jgi:hypothetical protein
MPAPQRTAAFAALITAAPRTLRPSVAAVLHVVCCTPPAPLLHTLSV